MHCDAMDVEALAPALSCDTAPGALQACPKPEHTGNGVCGGEDRQGDVLLHPDWGVYWSAFSRRASTGIGGGSYPRPLAPHAGERLYRVRKLAAVGEFASIGQALAQWRADQCSDTGARAAIIEIGDNGTYHESPIFLLAAGEQLQLRSANRARPVLRLVASQCMVVEGAAGSRFVLDGLMIAGGAIDIIDRSSADAHVNVHLRHCTLVPGWDPDSMQKCAWRGKESVTLRGPAPALYIEHCILGPVRIDAGPASRHLALLHVGESIIDGGHAAALVVSDTGYGAAMAKAQFSGVTVIGAIALDQLGRADNSIFLGALLVTQRGTGQVDFCYLAQGSRTPPCTLCQPEQAQLACAADAEREALRVRPRYLSLRYGAPGYGQLAPECATEIVCGADDDTEMGASHDGRHSGAMVPVSRRRSYAVTR